MLKFISQDLVAEINTSYPGVKALNLSGNSISRIENLDVLSCLTKIDLSGNCLTRVENLHQLPQLKELHLQNNKITGLDPSCSRLSSLEALDLANNCLQSLEDVLPVLAPLSNLRSLMLVGNPACETAGAVPPAQSYTAQVAAALPQLLSLDGLPQLSLPRPMYTGRGGSAAAPSSSATSSAAAAAAAQQQLASQVLALEARLVEVETSRVALQQRNEILAADRAQLLSQVGELQADKAQLRQQLQGAQEQLQRAADAAAADAAAAARREAARTSGADGFSATDAAARSTVEVQTSDAATAAAGAATGGHLRTTEAQTVESGRRHTLDASTQAAAAATAAASSQSAEQPMLRDDTASELVEEKAAVRSDPGEVAALTARIAALEHVVVVQEQELLRLAGLQQQHRQQHQEAGGIAAAASSSSSSGGDGMGPSSGAQQAGPLLQRWREEVAKWVRAYHQQVWLLEDAKASWTEELGGVRQQLLDMHALVGVLEGRAVDQQALVAAARAEAAEARGALQQEQARGAAHLQAAHAARQALQRCASAVAAHHEQFAAQAAGLEQAAGALVGFMQRLQFAAGRIDFLRQLSAAAAEGPAAPSAPAIALLPSPSPSAPSCVVGADAVAEAHAAPGLQQQLQQLGMAAAVLPLDVGVLQQELRRLLADRQTLLAQIECVRQQERARTAAAVAAAREAQLQELDGVMAAQLARQEAAIRAEAEAWVSDNVQRLECREQVARESLVLMQRGMESRYRQLEASLGLRLSSHEVRLQEAAQRLARAEQAMAAQRRSATAALQQAAEQQAAADEAAARTARAEAQVREHKRQADAELAALRERYESDLAAQRARASESEREAATAVVNCRQLERQVAKLRERHAEEAAAAVRELEEKLAAREAALASARRERNSLLALVRKHDLRSVVGAGSASNQPPTAVVGVAAAGRSSDSDGVARSQLVKSSLGAADDRPSASQLSLSVAASQQLPPHDVQPQQDNASSWSVPLPAEALPGHHASYADNDYGGSSYAEELPPTRYHYHEDDAESDLAPHDLPPSYPGALPAAAAGAMPQQQSHGFLPASDVPPEQLLHKLEELDTFMHELLAE